MRKIRNLFISFTVLALTLNSSAFAITFSINDFSNDELDTNASCNDSSQTLDPFSGNFRTALDCVGQINTGEDIVVDFGSIGGQTIQILQEQPPDDPNNPGQQEYLEYWVVNNDMELNINNIVFSVISVKFWPKHIQQCSDNPADHFAPVFSSKRPLPR